MYLSAGGECVPEVLLEVTRQPAHSGEEEKKNSLLRLWGSGHGQLPTPALLLAGPPGPAYGCNACGWGHPGLPSRRTELHSAVLTIVGELPPALGICWLVHLSRDCTKARTPFMWPHTGGAPGAAWRTRGRSCRHAPLDTGTAGNRRVRCPGYVPTLGQHGLPRSESRQCLSPLVLMLLV